MTFYSEYGEDKWIAGHLELPASGFYLDIGAGHPFVASNTAFLRERGWRGISIDARKYVEMWPGEFIHAAVSQNRIVAISNEGFCSRIADKGEQIAAITIDEIADRFAAKHIDLLSIDVEGHEFEAFNTFDWRLLTPAIVIAEYNTSGIGEDFRLRDQLLASGLYVEAHRTVANIIYTRK